MKTLEQCLQPSVVRGVEAKDARVCVPSIAMLGFRLEDVPVIWDSIVGTVGNY